MEVFAPSEIRRRRADCPGRNVHIPRRLPSAQTKYATPKSTCTLRSMSSPCPTLTGPRSSTSAWAGGSTMTSPRWTAFASSSSRPRFAASITFGLARTTSAPGSAAAALIVSDVEAAHEGSLTDRDIEVSEIWHGPPFPVEARQPGIDPQRTSYGSFFAFTDPDGNAWLVQEVTKRHPGRIDATGTSFATAADLASALRRAEAAHREHEKSRAVAPVPPVGRTRTCPAGTPPTWRRSRPGRTCRLTHRRSGCTGGAGSLTAPPRGVRPGRATR